MPKAYVILTESIHDQTAMDVYGRAAAPAIVESGGRILAVEPDPQLLEGEWNGRTVVLEFDSVEAARAWYDSPTYQSARQIRLAAAETNAVILTGWLYA
jgi:uncharacterized protein (DUF1330 family)